MSDRPWAVSCQALSLAACVGCAAAEPRVASAVVDGTRDPSGYRVVGKDPRDEASRHMVEEPFSVACDGAVIRGAFLRPASVSAPAPTVVVIAGSGPVDRDGNAGGVLRTDAYKQLAERLGERGIATVRYDKRGVGASDPTPESAVTLSTFVEDARRVAARVRSDPHVSSVFVLGHSEGGVIALEMARTTSLDGLILVATPGRPLSAVLESQLAARLDPALRERASRLLEAVREGRPLADVPDVLKPIFRASVAPFLRSLLEVDPAALLAAAPAKRALVIQGDRDVQISVEEDARRLVAAAPGTQLVIVHGMTHALKLDDARTIPQASYFDPAMPLAPDLVAAVASFVHRASS